MPISFRIPDEDARKLEEIARQTERTSSFHIKKALEIYFEEFADLQVALDRLHNKKDPIVSGKDMRKSLGL